MSLVRAFTTKRNANKPAPQISAPIMPQRSLTTKQSYGMSGTIRHKISAPVELISTTNMLSYNAPDLYPTSDTPPPLTFSSSSSSRSVSESSDEAHSVATPTSPDSITPGDIAPDSPTHNHLSCYFNSRTSTSSNESTTDPSAPIIPKRSPSHTKRNHEILHHQKSVSRISNKSKNSVTSFTRDSAQMFAATPELSEESNFDYAQQFEQQQKPLSAPQPKTRLKAPSVSVQQHPFGPELAQVTELAEEYGGSLHEVQIVDPEETDLINRGFFKFGVHDYLAEIQHLYATAFDEPVSNTMLWI